MKHDVKVENSRRQYGAAQRDGYTNSIERFVEDIQKVAAISRRVLTEYLDDDEPEILELMTESESAALTGGIALLERWMLQDEMAKMIEGDAVPCDCADCKIVERFEGELVALIPALVAALRRNSAKRAKDMLDPDGDRARAMKAVVDAMERAPDISPEALADVVAAQLKPGATFTAVGINSEGVEVATKRTGPPSTGPKPSTN